MHNPTGIKHDQEKPKMDLLDPDALEGLSKVLTFGANKYAAHNWRGGILYSRIVASLLRHLMAFQKGEDIDPESGLPHIDHIGCNWMFLSYFTKHRVDLDDRFRLPNTPVVAEQAGNSNRTNVGGNTPPKHYRVGRENLMWTNPQYQIIPPDVQQVLTNTQHEET